jgi:DNA-binding CsgD family transcriptional regulator
MAVRRDLTAPGVVDIAWTTAELARCGSNPGQQARWRQVVEACRAGGARWDEAVARWRLAQAALVEHEPRGHVEPILRQAQLLATELHADPLVEEVRSLARAAKVSLTEVATATDPASLPAVLASLTLREQEVLRHLVAGRSNSEIARELVISDKTASVHVSNILRKTGTTSRLQAAELARRLGR